MKAILTICTLLVCNIIFGQNNAQVYYSPNPPSIIEGEFHFSLDLLELKSLSFFENFVERGEPVSGGPVLPVSCADWKAWTGGVTTVLCGPARYYFSDGQEGVTVV